MNKRPRHGFTLIELLVAIAVLSVMMVVVLSLTASVGSMWTRASREEEVLTLGRGVLNQISRDLTSAELKNLSKSVFLQFVQNPPWTQLPGTLTPVVATDSLAWQAQLARFTTANPTTSDRLAVVGYYLCDSKDGRGLYRYYAERPLVGASASPAYNIYVLNPSKSVPWLNDASMNGATLWDGTASPGQGANILSNNVLGLWIRCRDVNGQPIPYNQVRDPTSAPLPSIKYDSNWKGTNNHLPSYVEITIVCVDSRSLGRSPASQLSTILPAINDPSTYDTSATPPSDGYPTGVDPYTRSVDQFISDLKNVAQFKDAEIRPFSTTVNLVNGDYAN